MGVASSHRSYLEFNLGNHAYDGRCKVCKHHKFLIQDIHQGAFYIHSWLSEVESLSRSNIIHSWNDIDHCPKCRLYYKEIL